jgi:hypothetical protein
VVNRVLIVLFVMLVIWTSFCISLFLPKTCRLEFIICDIVEKVLTLVLEIAKVKTSVLPIERFSAFFPKSQCYDSICSSLVLACVDSLWSASFELTLIFDIQTSSPQC